MQSVPFKRTSLEWPPCSAHAEVRREQDRYWLIGNDERSGGYAALVLPLTPAGMALMAWLEPRGDDDLRMIGITTAFFLIIILLLTADC